ncbi:MAG: hypothetical protein K2O70_07855 [Desulfovibrionaceae bacterium]|nr:hypothetical protein [Desulfovibrionaceae bacterium]
MPVNDSPMLRQCVRWGEEYVSSALNQKFAGIISPGIYRGFVVRPGGTMAVVVEHDASGGPSVAVVERNGYSLTVLMDDPCTVSIPAAGTWFICIEAFYSVRQTGYQRIVAREQREAHHVVLATVSVTENGIEILSSMISDRERQQASIPSATDIHRLQLDMQAEIAMRTARTRHSWQTKEAIAENGTLELPVPYVAGEHSLLLFYEGLLLDESNFTEIGEVGSISNSVKLLFTASADSMFCVTIFGASAAGAENADVLKALGAAIERANAAAEKAEQVGMVGSELSNTVNGLTKQIQAVADGAAYVTAPGNGITV